MPVDLLSQFANPAAIRNPAAYGTIPNIPPYSINTTDQTQRWTTDLYDYEKLGPQASALVGRQMAGVLDPNVLATMGQGAAERGIGTGTGALAPATNAAYLRAIGLSTNALEQQGITNYLNLLAQSPRTTTTSARNVVDNNVARAIALAGANPYAAAMANLAATALGRQAGGGADPSAALASALARARGGTDGGGGFTLTGGAPAFTSGATMPTSPGYGPTGQVFQSPTAGAGGTPSTGTTPTGYGAAGQQGYGSFFDVSGNEWVVLNDGSVMNLTTGETATNMSAALSGQTTSGSVLSPDYWGGDTGGDFLDYGLGDTYWDDWLTDITGTETTSDDYTLPYMDDYWWEDLATEQTPTEEAAASESDFYTDYWE